jgi:hypothetical protein
MPWEKTIFLSAGEAIFRVQIVNRHLQILSFPVVSSEFHLDLGKAVKSPSKGEVRFQKYGVLNCVKSSFSNDDSKRLEDHFEKWTKAFVPKISKKNNLFRFIHRCHRCG